MTDHERPMSFFSGAQSERSADGDTAQLSSTRRSVPHVPDTEPFPHPARAALLQDPFVAKSCGDESHLHRQHQRGIHTTTYCLTCAVTGASTLELRPTGRTIREDTDEIMEWAFDLAEGGVWIAEKIARCAAERPHIFLLQYEVDTGGAGKRLLRRAKAELHGVYDALDDLIHVHEEQTANTALGASLRVVIDALGSGLALLEEM